jgi:uncharacterized membrane protein YciS (DUF1049 family)
LFILLLLHSVPSFLQVIILTLKKAAPNVVRYLLCAVLLYAGFTFCGWLILGPYHMKVCVKPFTFFM